MRRLWLSLMLLCWAAAGAQAGPNEGGTLVWHLDPSVVYTNDIDDYCGASGIACERDFNGCDNGYDFEDECRPQFDLLNPTGPADTGVYVASVLAAFPEGSCPRVAGVTFGFRDYDDGNIFFVDQGPCGDFELPTGNWPGQFEGTAVTFGGAVVSQLAEVYWFAAYAYYADQDGSLELAEHPTQGGNFADDSVPSILDPIVGFSTLGLNGTPGENVLPAGGPAEGACCFEDGSCQVLTADDCGAATGEYLGDDTVCDPNPCPQPPAEGACCFEDGSCQVLTEFDCIELNNGDYQGDDTVCDPNPCPQPPAEGACCFPDGSCQVLTEFDCVELNDGDYQGDDTVCDPNPCPQPPAEGACCFEEGNCEVLTLDDCSAAGGEYEGDDTVCDPNPCPQPPEVGACCFEDGTCLILTQDDCESGGGRASETPRTQNDLAARGTGQPGEYQGDGTTCDPNPCPQPPGTGACCFEDGTCEVLTADACDEAEGSYQGTDTVCDPNPCPQPPKRGACCFEDGTCELQTEEDCGSAGGTYEGDDTVCDPNPCPQPPAMGACCFEDGTCEMQTEVDCGSAGGAYQGDDTTCDPNPCPQPPAMGACCFEDGSCQMQTEEDCGSVGGTYQGDDTTCDPNPCVADLGALDITATIVYGGNEEDAVVDVNVTGPSFVFDGQTPVLVEDLVPGVYQVKWVKPGHGACTTEYTVDYGETVDASCGLIPYYVSVMQFVTEASPGRIDMADLDSEVTVRIKGFTGNLDAGSIDLDWIYLGNERVVDADARVVGLSATDKGIVEFTVPARKIVEAAEMNGPTGPQQLVRVDVWTRIEGERWVRSELRLSLYRNTAALSTLSSEGTFGAVVRPNPARGDAWIEWNSPVASTTDLTIYDASGRVLRRLVSGTRIAGVHQAQWDGRDASGVAMPSGVYYYRLSLLDTGEQISDKIYLVR